MGRKNKTAFRQQYLKVLVMAALWAIEAILEYVKKEYELGIPELHQQKIDTAHAFLTEIKNDLA